MMLMSICLCTSYNISF